MEKRKGLVIIHVDGLGYHYLQKALEQGRMPFVQNLIDHEGYEVLPYRCGLPSTTPFCQAGILYGDNSEIPSFRWWDKQSGLLVAFGGLSSFKHVAHKYFNGCDPLTRGGASIATCYPDSTRATWRLGYREHGHPLERQPFSQRRVLESWALNPIHLLDWLRRGLWEIWKANVQYWRTRLSGRRMAVTYVIGDMLNEILLHHLTRFAVIQAMKEGLPVIYGGFYAYDETGHAFGPGADYSFRILRHVDNTIRRIARNCHPGEPGARDYEMVILSDHGQVETVPFSHEYHCQLADSLAQWLPTYEIEETKGKHITCKGAIDGHIMLTYSGGLAHMYFKDISWHLRHDEIEERFPGLIEKVAGTPGIGFILTRGESGNILTTKDEQIKFTAGCQMPRAARELLVRYDDPEILAQQLEKLNSFERAGDLILFGQSTDHHQINFENQVGGHGSIGGDQLFPFILAKREWKFDTSKVISSSDLYPLLKRLRDQLIS
ncbi:MAG: alkaline phosphatase family protein [Acidobacteriota bacterium]